MIVKRKNKLKMNTRGIFMKYRMLLIAFMLGMIVTGCNKEQNSDVPKIEISDKTEESVSSDIQEDSDKNSEENAETEEGNLKEGFQFSDLKNMEFYFGSGAGGWRTIMHVGEDGSFWGEYSDSDMGSTGEGYSKGKYYYCAFEGNFTKPVKVNDYTYSVGIAEISYADKPGTVEIIDEILHIYSEPYGIENANSLLIYLPGAPLDELPEEYLDWVRMGILDEESNELPFYGVYNEKEENGFSSYEIKNPIDEMLDSAKERAAIINDSLENEVLTQSEMNTKSHELYEVWDGILNELWAEVKNTLSDEKYQEVLNEQRAWIKEKEAAVEKAGADVAGGSMEPLVRNLEAAAITEERVYELYKLLK